VDNLTHTLTGVLLSRAGLNSLHKHAAWILLLSANAPDIDAVSMLGGLVPYMFYHRWYTHALVMMPIIALVPLIVLRLFFRNEPFHWMQAWALSLIGVASHVLLDYTNPYGIRLLLPFSDEWPRLSIMSVVDVGLWVLLLAAVAWPALSRLVSDEIGARRPRGRGLATFALILMLIYVGSRLILHRRAVEVQQAVTITGSTPRRVFAVPDGMNPFRWKGIVETDTFFAVQTVDLAATEAISDPAIHYKPVTSAAIEAANRTDVFQTFTKFSAVFLWRTTPDAELEGGTRVEALDLQLGFAASALVDDQNRVVRTSVRF
jgi:inner membrane protein